MNDLLLLAAQTASNPTDMKAWAYLGFIGLVLAFLALDLGVFHREAHEVSIKEAAVWSIVWVTCGIAFSGFVYKAYDANWLGLGLDTPRYNLHELAGTTPDQPLIVTGKVTGAEAAEQYLVGYVVEKSLSMDNIFVIALILGFFAVPPKYQHRVLFWGIIGALAMRGGMILIGAGLILRYQWILIVFGGFLVLTALKMALIKGNDDPAQNFVVRTCRKLLPTVDFFDGPRFVTRRTSPHDPGSDAANGGHVPNRASPAAKGARWAITPLFLALMMVEVTDLVFAVDSIPAIFAITPDPFIVFTSNIFAILGLRALYFCLAALMARFRFLKPALIVILAFVGVKLLLMSLPPYLGLIGMQPRSAIKIDTEISLCVVLGTLALATLLSVMIPAKHAPIAKPHDAKGAGPRQASESTSS